MTERTCVTFSCDIDGVPINPAELRKMLDLVCDACVLNGMEFSDVVLEFEDWMETVKANHGPAFKLQRADGILCDNGIAPAFGYPVTRDL